MSSSTRDDLIIGQVSGMQSVSVENEVTSWSLVTNKGRQAKLAEIHESLSELSIENGVEVLPVDETCIMCTRRGQKTCAKCGNAKYCSKDCQVLDWPNHKILCRHFRAQERPEEDSRRALFFPGGTVLPKFVWIKTAVGEWEGVPRRFHNTDDFLVAPVIGTGNHDTNQVQGRSIARVPGEAVQVCFKPVQPEDDNEGLVKFTRAGAGVCPRFPFMAMRVRFDDPGPEEIQDMDMRDARTMADAMTIACRMDLTSLEADAPKALAGLINCPAYTSGRCVKYNEKGLPANHPIFFEGQPSTIFNMVGLPLLIMAAAIDGEDLEVKGEEQFLNEDARLLTLNLNITEDFTTPKATQDAFGTAAKMIGPVMVVRADGRPIIRSQMEIFCEYVKQIVEPLIQSATDDLRSRESVLKEITKDGFLKFFADYKAKQVRAGVPCAACDDPSCDCETGFWRSTPDPWSVAGSGLVRTSIKLDKAVNDPDPPNRREHTEAMKLVLRVPPGI